MKFDVGEIEQWRHWIGSCDERIKSGAFASVRGDLRRLNTRSIPRQFLADVANLARRTQLTSLVLRLLHPIVRPPEEFASDATQDETALYAVGLTRIGAYAEAKALFQSFASVDTNTLLLWASSEVSQWNYEKARLLYGKYLRRPGLSEYSIIVAQLNLAACYTSLGRYEDAIVLLEEITRISGNFPLIRGNAFEVSAQCHFVLKDYASARRLSESSRLFLTDSSSSYHLYSRKWEIVSQCFQSGRLNEEFRALRQEALSLRNFEAVRDMDLLSAVLRQDQALFFRVYQGTPFQSFRRRAKFLYGDITVPNRVLITAQGPTSGLSFAPETGVVAYADEHSIKTELALSGKKLTLLRCFARDLYRPQPLGAIFAALCPGEVFAIHTSPNRIRKAISLLNSDLKSASLPAQVVVHSGTFRLGSEADSWILNDDYPPPLEALPDPFVQWLQRPENPILRRTDVERTFSISRATAARWLRRAVQNDLLQPGPLGSVATYRKKPPKAA